MTAPHPEHHDRRSHHHDHHDHGMHSDRPPISIIRTPTQFDRASVNRPSSQYDRQSARFSILPSIHHADRPKSIMEPEVGVIDAIPRRDGQPHPVIEVSQRRLNWEQRRPRILIEMMAEALGLFICVYNGMAASTSLHINHGNPVAGSVLMSGFAYGLSTPLAIVTCAPASGGHFNPAITLCFAFWKGFPLWKVPLYILAQIIGAFLAALCVWVQYWQWIEILQREREAHPNRHMFDAAMAGMLVTFPKRWETNQAILFMTEWLADSFVAIVTWAAIDAGNTFTSVIPAPFIIGLSYASIIWGFGATTLSMNLARDLGARLVDLMFFGRKSFTYMHFSWIPLFVNVPATFVATAYYELMMKNSLLTINAGAAVHEDGEEALEKHLKRNRLTIVKGQIVKDEE